MGKEEEEFQRQVSEWEKDVEKWRKENEKHPDKAAFKRHLDRYAEWKKDLDQRRLMISKDSVMTRNKVPAPPITSRVSGSNIKKNESPLEIRPPYPLQIHGINMEQSYTSPFMLPVYLVPTVVSMQAATDLPRPMSSSTALNNLKTEERTITTCPNLEQPGGQSKEIQGLKTSKKKNLRPPPEPPLGQLQGLFQIGTCNSTRTLNAVEKDEQPEKTDRRAEYFQRNKLLSDSLKEACSSSRYRENIPPVNENNIEPKAVSSLKVEKLCSSKNNEVIPGIHNLQSFNDTYVKIPVNHPFHEEKHSITEIDENIHPTISDQDNNSIRNTFDYQHGILRQRCCTNEQPRAHTHFDTGFRREQERFQNFEEFDRYPFENRNVSRNRRERFPSRFRYSDSESASSAHLHIHFHME